MNIGTEDTQHALRPPPVPVSLSAGARQRWQVGILVAVLVAVLGGSGAIVSASLSSIQQATRGVYEIEKARIDRMESDIAVLKAELPSVRDRLTGIEADIKYLVAAERRRQTNEDKARLLRGSGQ